MSITLLVLAAAATVAVAMYVVATATADGATALAGDQTVVGLGDAAAETLADGRQSPGGAGVWNLATVCDLTDAEDLLDSLEARGVADRELVVLGNASFAVRWR